MKVESEIKLDFNDVLIKPKRSSLESRSQVDLNREYKFKNSSRKVEVGIPLIAANMDTIATFEMARVLSKRNIWTALHKFYAIDEIEEFFKEEEEVASKCFYSLGINEDDFDKIKKLQGLGVELPFICVDVANGYSQKFVNECGYLRTLFPSAVILAGNVCTPEMVQELLISGGVDIIKVGIGGGSGCITRHTTGIGFPQLSAVIECGDAAHGLGGHICSDGGCRAPGDIAKAFAAGADFVMMGGMLAGHDECGGEFRLDEKGEKKTMCFYGMSSELAMKKYYGGKASYRASEGRVMEVSYKGPVDQTIEQILGGLRSTCTYVGTDKLKDLSKCTTFIRVNRVHDNMN
jgi:GMP reductase